MTTAEIIGLSGLIGTLGLGFGGIIYRLGGLHADIRRLVDVVGDHEARIRDLERD